jgi:hypothetical protein
LLRTSGTGVCSLGKIGGMSHPGHPGDRRAGEGEHVVPNRLRSVDRCY